MRAPAKKPALRPGRRGFVKTAAALSAGLLAGKAAEARADETIELRFQSTWPTRDIFHEYALDFANKVNEMSVGRLRIEMLPAGAMVKAFDLIDAVHKGVLDGGHGVAAYWYARNSAFSLFGTSPLAGLDANQMLAWIEYGGGKELYRELQQEIMGYEVEGLLYGPMPTQPLGWFKKPIRSTADLRGLRFRTVGLATELFREMGAHPVTLPAGEIVGGLDRGTIDAAEFNNASSDRRLGFPDVVKVCMLQSYHQNAEFFEVLINKRRYDSLAADLRAIIRYAAQASSAEMSWKAIDRYSRDYFAMQNEDKVQFYRTPREVLEAQLKAWDRVIAAKARENPFFAKVVESQKKWLKRVGKWSLDTHAPAEIALAHWLKPRLPVR
jgi:TRAP-type mannitol/chloroaromatic compound transport system substrate-binding protein